MNPVRIAIGSDAKPCASDRYLSALVVEKWNIGWAKQAKIASGGRLQVGVYVNGGYMRASLGPFGLCSTGVPLGDCGLYLPGGRSYANSGDANLIAANISDPTYAGAVAAFVLEHDPMKVGGLEPDFVFLDDVNYRLNVGGPQPIEGYYIAMYAFVKRLASLLHAGGVKVIPNIGAWHEGSVAAWGDMVAAVCDGGMSEHAISYWPAGGAPVIQWAMDRAVISAQHVGDHGGMFLAIGHGDTPAIRVAARDFQTRAPKALIGVTTDEGYSKPFLAL